MKIKRTTRRMDKRDRIWKREREEKIAKRILAYGNVGFSLIEQVSLNMQT